MTSPAPAERGIRDSFQDEGPTNNVKARTSGQDLGDSSCLLSARSYRPQQDSVYFSSFPTRYLTSLCSIAELRSRIPRGDCTPAGWMSADHTLNADISQNCACLYVSHWSRLSAEQHLYNSAAQLFWKLEWRKVQMFSKILQDIFPCHQQLGRPLLGKITADSNAKEKEELGPELRCQHSSQKWFFNKDHKCRGYFRADQYPSSSILHTVLEFSTVSPEIK